MAFYNLIEHWRRHDVIDAVPLLAEKLCVNVFLFQFERLYQIFRQRFNWNECKYQQLTKFFWCLSKCKLQWVASKVYMNHATQCNLHFDKPQKN